MVLAPVHEPRVEAERDVVQEEPVADAADVDAPLDPVVEGGERRERIVAVEAEVAGEVVPRPERDADERHVLLDRDLGDRRERAVAAGHPEHVRAGLPRHLGQVVALLQQVDGDAPLARGVAELVGTRRVRAGAWVDDEE